MIKKGPRPTNIAKQRDYDDKFQKPWSQKLGIDFLELIMAPDYTDADVLKIRLETGYTSIQVFANSND